MGQGFDISIHAPAKGATLRFLSCVTSSRHFNPRSREGSDNATVHLPPVVSISIHAPAKGATGDKYIRIWNGDISIHAPAKGATVVGDSGFHDGLFQSTLPRRERLNLLAPLLLVLISIHAPAKGATRDEVHYLDVFDNFNPRSREGSDPTSKTLMLPAQYFNPRSREGSDRGHHGYDLRRYPISIHAPAKGATVCPKILQK